MTGKDSMGATARLLLAAAAGAAIALLAWTWLGPRTTVGSTDAVLARLDAMQAEAEARDAALRRELAELQRRNGITTPSRSSLPPDPERQAQAQASAAGNDAAMRAGIDAQRRELEAIFAAEGAAPSRDPVPARVEKAFLDPGVLASPELPLEEDVQCRARLCLISARFKPYEDGVEWGSRVMMELAAIAPDARLVSVPLPDGGRELRIYAARTGQHAALRSP